MAQILYTARALMTLLSPMLGTAATGNLTVASTSGTVTLPKNSYCFAVIPGSAATQISPRVLLKTTAATNVTTLGVSVPVKAVIGGGGGNLAAATTVRWAPPIADISSTSVVAAGGLTGGAAATGFGAVKDLRFYEQIGAARAAADLFRGNVNLYPAMVLIWDATSVDTDKRPGRSRYGFQESWTLAIVSSRTDSDEERRAEGLYIMEEATERLIGRQQADGEVISLPTSIEIRRRGRLIATEQTYIYTVDFYTNHTIERREHRNFVNWVTTRFDFDTQSGTSPEVPIVDNAKETMP